MKKENCKVGDKVVPFQKTRGWSFDQSEAVKNMQEKGYLYISSIEPNSVTLNCDENALSGERFAYEDFEPYIEPKQEPKPEQADNRPNFFNHDAKSTCNCHTSREKECRFFVIDEDNSVCKNRKFKDSYQNDKCHSPEAQADYYSRNLRIENSKVNSFKITNDSHYVPAFDVLQAENKEYRDHIGKIECDNQKLESEKQELRLQLEKQIALNVGKDEEINKLKYTNGKLLASIKDKNSIIANYSKAADKDAKEFSELKNKNERLEDRIFNLSLEILSNKEEIKQLEQVINYYERKRNEKNKGKSNRSGL